MRERTGTRRERNRRYARSKGKGNKLEGVGPREGAKGRGRGKGCVRRRTAYLAVLLNKMNLNLIRSLGGKRELRSFRVKKGAKEDDSCKELYF